MGPKRIELPLFDLQRDKLEERISHYIELGEKYLLWVLEAYLTMLPRTEDENDLGITKENQYVKASDFIMKKDINWVDSRWDRECEVWILTITSSHTSIDGKFETESELRKVEGAIQQWLIAD